MPHKSSPLQFDRLVIAFCVIVGLALGGYVVAMTGPLVTAYSIPAGSMYPTLSVGERMFASVGYYHRHAPEIGDVALFVAPRNGSMVVFVKRVVAGPGNHVAMEQGRFVLNGVAVERRPSDIAADPEQSGHRYIETLPNGRSYEIVEQLGDLGPLDSMAEVTVPPGQYFVLGDNRDNSMDSRVPDFGFVAAEAFHDRPSIIWFSTDWRRLGKPIQPKS